MKELGKVRNDHSNADTYSNMCYKPSAQGEKINGSTEERQIPYTVGAEQSKVILDKCFTLTLWDVSSHGLSDE